MSQMGTNCLKIARAPLYCLRIFYREIGGYAEKTKLSGRGKYVIMEKLVSEKLWTQVSLFSKNAN